MVRSHSFWKGRRVLVTGGAGFVGFWLASELVMRGARVYVLSQKSLPRFLVLDRDYSKKMTLIKGSITSKKLVFDTIKRHKIQTIFHLAAQAIVGKSVEGTLETLETNIRGTWLILEAARRNPTVTETVFASSDKAYGSHEHLPYRENFALQGRYPYDCSKSCADLLAQMYAVSFKLPVIVIRCANIYGGGDLNWSRLIPDALRTAFNNTTLQIRSNGKFRRDYLYVADVVDGYIRAAELLHKKNLTGEAFNLAAGRALTVLQVIQMLERVLGKKIKRNILGQGSHEIRDQYLNASKAKRILGWQPRYSHHEGFQKTAEWYRAFLK